VYLIGWPIKPCPPLRWSVAKRRLLASPIPPLNWSQSARCAARRHKHYNHHLSYIAKQWKCSSRPKPSRKNPTRISNHIHTILHLTSRIFAHPKKGRGMAAGPNQSPRLRLTIDSGTRNSGVGNTAATWNPSNTLHGRLEISCTISFELSEASIFLEG
jgi:hypothetical protein